MLTNTGAKTVRYGTAIMPTVVKGIIGGLPSSELIDQPLSSVTGKDLSYHKKDQFPEAYQGLEGRYPSVSTILGCTTSQRLLYQWQLKMIKQLGGLGAFKKYMRVRIQSGTRYHSCVQRILEEFKRRGSFPDDTAEQIICEIDASVTGYLSSVLPILRVLDTENMELERTTKHHGLYYSGRFDAAITYKDALFLIDWKTASPGSTKDVDAKIDKMYNDPLQLAAYVGAINSDPNFRTLPEIRYGAVVIAKDDGSEADVVEMHDSDLEVYWRKWLNCIQQFWTEMKTRSSVNDVISFVWNGDENVD